MRLPAGAGFCSLFLFSMSAIADGPRMGAPVGSDPACCIPNWSGGYLAAGIGGSWGDVKFRESHANALVTGANSHDLAPSAFVGNLTVGYDHRLGDAFLVGVFGDYIFGQRDANFSLDYTPLR